MKQHLNLQRLRNPRLLLRQSLQKNNCRFALCIFLLASYLFFNLPGQSTDAETCRHSPAQPTQKLGKLPYLNTTNASNPSSLSDYVPLCEFTNGGGVWRHFPHTMQQLYFCWSYWQTHNMKQPILVDRKGPIEHLKAFATQGRHSFVPGFRRALREVFDVQIVGSPPRRQPQTIHSVDLLSEPPYNDYYIIDSPLHMKKLRDGIVQHYFPTKTSHDDNNDDIVPSCSRMPRVAILNRQGSRSLLNIQEIQQSIAQLLRKQEDFPNHVDASSISVTYFEGRSFLDQVQFFSTHDIIVTGHGAQLTGVPFLPDCGGVLELHPPNYLTPTFFGTLIELSGLTHRYIYLHNSSVSHRGETQAQRTLDRAVNFCPPPTAIQEGVQQLIDEWKTCCQRKRSPNDP